MMLRNLAPRLAERGKIKIGIKGAKVTSRSGNEFQPPQKLDHFVVTTLERGPDGNFVRDEEIHRSIGDKPRRIPVRLLFNDIEMNFMSRYACFVGRQMWCAGDGETAQRIGQDGHTREAVQCPCPRIEQGYAGKDKCKVNGALSVIIDGVPGVGNVWTFRTTSWNSVQNLTSAMYQIKALSGGVLAGLPIDLVLAPKEVTAPDGKMMKAWIVSMQFSGTVEDLRGIGYKLLEAEATHNFRVRQVEDDVRTRLSLPAPMDVPLPGDDASDVVDEFYPDQAVADSAPPRPTRDEFSKSSNSADGHGDHADDSPAFYVYDEFGEKVGGFPTEKEALAMLIKMINAAKAVGVRDALSEINPDLYAAIQNNAGSPPLPATSASAAVNSSDERKDDPSAPNGSGGALSAWDAGEVQKTDRFLLPLSDTDEVRFFSGVKAWGDALVELAGKRDPYEIWQANVVEHTRLSLSTKHPTAVEFLKNVADHVNLLVRDGPLVDNPGM